MDLGEGPRILSSSHYGPVLAESVRLTDTTRIPGTFGWLSRFSIVTTGETAAKWPTVNALYVDGVLDREGAWQADFPEPTPDDPTIF